MKSCNQKIKVIYPGRRFGLDADNEMELPCCLKSPHKGYKHYNPRLQLTVGGDRISTDSQGNDIIKSWSYGIEEK